MQNCHKQLDSRYLRLVARQESAERLTKLAGSPPYEVIWAPNAIRDLDDIANSAALPHRDRQRDVAG